MTEIISTVRWINHQQNHVINSINSVIVVIISSWYEKNKMQIHTKITFYWNSSNVNSILSVSSQDKYRVPNQEPHALKDIFGIKDLSCSLQRCYRIAWCAGKSENCQIRYRKWNRFIVQTSKSQSTILIALIKWNPE